MNFDKQRDQIKATVTMDDVCERLGIHVPRDRKIRSIYRDEKTPSLHVYKADYYDYSTGQGGDVIRFVMDAKGWSYPQAIRWISRSNASSFVSTRMKEEQEEVADLTDLFTDMAEAQHNDRQLWAEYSLHKWGVPLFRIEEWGSKITLHGELWTPHWHNGRVRGIKRRTLHGKKMSVTGSQYTHGLYYPKGSLGEADNDVFIVEGESDVWALKFHMSEADAVVVGLPSGASLWRDKWRNDLAYAHKIYVATDKDDAGTEARKRIVGSITSMPNNPPVYNLYPPGGRVAEALMAGYRWHSWWATLANAADMG